MRTHRASAPTPPRKPRPSLAPWARSYARGVAVTDALVVLVAAVGALLVRFVFLSEGFGSSGQFYVFISALLSLAWFVALKWGRTREPGVLGDGPEEYARVFNVTLFLFGSVAIFSFIVQFQTSRGYLAIAFPIGLFGLLLSRKLWRRHIQRRRARGFCTHQVLVIGGVDSAEQIARWLLRHPSAGYRVAGVWCPGQRGAESRDDVPECLGPVFGAHTDLETALRLIEASVVVVSDTEHLGHEGLRQLSWDLHDLEVDLMVSPNVMDVAGPRVHLRAVGNMPFIHLEEPQFKAAATITKTVFDRTFAVMALALASPIMLATALAVKLTSQGPVFYRSERLGKDGAAFKMLKFRTMIEGADQQVDALRDTHDVKSVLFKLEEDPRVTPIGRFLRRYSIDELPQLINVLKGEMSVVGPRPPLRTEVEAYDDFTAKRLLVKQGITGLWQISGRADLDWEETVRIDLDYVENWSMIRDLQIIWRTARAVLRGEGAY